MSETFITVPSDSLLNQVPLKKDYLKVYNVSVVKGIGLEKIVGTFFSSSPEWLQEINSTGNEIKEKIGFKVSEKNLNSISPGKLKVGDRIGNYLIKAINEREILLAEDGKSTKTRLSFFLLPLKEGHQKQVLVISHLVQFVGLMGRLYWKGVRYYQEELMRETIDNTAKKLTNHK